MAIPIQKITRALGVLRIGCAVTVIVAFQATSKLNAVRVGVNYDIARPEPQWLPIFGCKRLDLVM